MTWAVVVAAQGNPQREAVLLTTNDVPAVINDDYNIERYTPQVTVGPRKLFREQGMELGEPVPRFSCPTVDGGSIDLDTITNGHQVALVFGSYSAPPVVLEMPGLENLYQSLDHSKQTIVFVYTREIHPSEELAPHFKNLPRHRSLEQKIAQARAFRDDMGLSFEVAVDDLSGTIDRAYGSLPFFHVVIDGDGTLIQRSEWADADLLTATFANLTKREQLLAGDSHEGPRNPATCFSRWYR